MISLKKAIFSDLETIEVIQRKSFKMWYEKYHDESNPYLETRESIEEKFNRPMSTYYLIQDGDQVIGYLRMQTNIEETEIWLAIVAVLPEYQRKGYASSAIKLLEESYPSIKKWDLCTIFQEKSLVKLYEKCGYQATHTELLQEGMDLVFMTKIV